MHGIATISSADAHQGRCAPKAITAATRITCHPLNLAIVENGKGLNTISSKDGLEGVVLQGTEQRQSAATNAYGLNTCMTNRQK